MQQVYHGLTLALGDLAVKLLITLIMLIPFRLLLNKIKDYSDNSAFQNLNLMKSFFFFQQINQLIDLSLHHLNLEHQ